MWRQPYIQFGDTRFDSCRSYALYDVVSNRIIMRVPENPTPDMFCNPAFADATPEELALKYLIHELTHWAQICAMTGAERLLTGRKYKPLNFDGTRECYEQLSLVERHALWVEEAVPEDWL